jgi:formylglycine-generating enzyme required for sulfatase activity
MPPTKTTERRWQRFTAALAQASRAGGHRLDSQQIADLLWMTTLLAGDIPAQPNGPQPPLSTPAPESAGDGLATSAAPASIAPAAAVGSPQEQPPSPPPKAAADDEPEAALDPNLGNQTPAAGRPRVSVAESGLLPHPRRLGRALAPLNRQVETGPACLLDVPATVEAIARARAERRPWQPVLRPRRQGWLALHLVFDGHTSMEVWERLRRELPRCLSQQVGWRDLHCWSLSRNPSGTIELRSVNGRPGAPGQLRRPGGRDLVLVVSDLLAPSWRDGAMAAVLHDWAEVQPVLLLQVLPPRLWRRTGLTAAEGGWVQARQPLQHNARLQWQPLEERPFWLDDPSAPPPPSTVTLPLATLEPRDLAAMAGLLTAAGGNSLRGFRFELPALASAPPEPPAPPSQTPPAPPSDQRIEELLAVFLFTASLDARRLLALLTYAPLITLPVVRLVLKQQGGAGGPAVIAEVLFSGLFRNVETAASTKVPIDQQQLCFVDEVPGKPGAEGLRERLREGLRVGQARAVFQAVKQHVAQSLNLTVESFEALLRDPNAEPLLRERLSDQGRLLLRAFASVSTRCLRGLGPDYDQLADAIETAWSPAAAKNRLGTEAAEEELGDEDQGEEKRPHRGLGLFSLEFETAWLEEIALQPITFTTSVLIQQPKVGFRAIGRPFGGWTREDQDRQAWAFREPEGPAGLTLVQIPSGSFLMGSESESGRASNEGPQHTVTLQEFWMSQTQITQMQWREVAGWEPGPGEKWGRKLEPYPSRFKGDDRPVENVSWFAAMEFCNRLSQRTGRTYTLPSEAQWEYACRADTITPFHFGATITPELANYDGNQTYANGPKGESQGKTTPVASFPANAWGLHDMHGNVWEWCLDHWHNSYEGAPSDGSAWLDPVQSEEEDKKKHRLLRGGSWVRDPGSCRSACRGRFGPDGASSHVGFRVVCLPQGRSS